MNDREKVAPKYERVADGVMGVLAIAMFVFWLIGRIVAWKWAEDIAFFFAAGATVAGAVSYWRQHRSRAIIEIGISMLFLILGIYGALS